MPTQKPLEGLRVVELTTYVAAPTCGKLLRDQGAEVIKVEAPRGDAWRYNFALSDHPNPRFHICNAGKKSIVLDLKTEEGLAALHKLVARADVFITNTRSQSLIRLGLDHDTLCERYPRLIYAFLSGYGEAGPDADLPGFDTVAYWAKSGFMADMSISTGHNYPVDSPVGVGDSVTGMTLYAGVMTALLQRERTGRGDYVTASLYNTGIWAVSGSIILSQYPSVTMPRTRDTCFPESSAYRCADGEWLQLCILEFDRYAPSLFAALGYPDILKDPRYSTFEARLVHNGELVALAEEVFATKTVEEWLDILRPLDIVCCRIAHFADIPHSEQAWANDYLERLSYGGGDDYVVPRSPIRMGSRPTAPLEECPALGADTAAVLAELEDAR